MARFSRTLALASGCIALALLGACSSGSTSQASTTTIQTPSQPRDMRNVRYCEVLLISSTAEQITASVYNTYPLNECPEDQWVALDPKAIAAQNGATVAMLNGPRYWMINAVEKVGTPTTERTKFGDLEMYKQATVPVVSLAEQSRAYAPNAVNRSTIFFYNAGTEIFQLTSPDGSIYVMQSYSQQKDPTLTLATLPSLRTKLKLPEGWSFSSRILSEDLEIVTVNTPAQVLQDDLGNSYSLLPSTPDAEKGTLTP